MTNHPGPKTELPAESKPGCSRCGIGTPIFKNSCIVCCSMSDAHADLLYEVLKHKLRAESQVETLVTDIKRALQCDISIVALATLTAALRKVGRLSTCQIPKCLYHENCDLPAGHEKCQYCGRGKGGVCAACHCGHTLHADVAIAERKLQAARNRIEDDCNTSENLLESMGAIEARNAELEANLSTWTATAQRLQEKILDYENKEGSVCPEDVGFVEYIKHLQAKLAAAEGNVNAWTQTGVELQAENRALRAELDETSEEIAASVRAENRALQNRVKELEAKIPKPRGYDAALGELKDKP